jgi:hypothetical protein
MNQLAPQPILLELVSRAHKDGHQLSKSVRSASHQVRKESTGSSQTNARKDQQPQLTEVDPDDLIGLVALAVGEPRLVSSNCWMGE